MAGKELAASCCSDAAEVLEPPNQLTAMKLEKMKNM
jgi:hypothetical protein